MANAASTAPSADPAVTPPTTIPTYTIASPQRSKTESMNAPNRETWPGRPSERPVEQVEDPAEEHHQPGGEPGIRGGQDGADDRDPEADQRQAVRGETEAPEEQGDRLGQLLDPGRGSRGSPASRHRPPRAAHPAGSSVRAGTRGGPGRGRPLAGQGLVERLRTEAADRLAAASSRRHEPRCPELAEVPADQRLGQADVLDQLGDARRAASTGAGRSAAG